MASGDRRDDQSWVVLELTRSGEQCAQDGTLEQLLRDALGVDQEHPIFIPAVTYCRDGQRFTIHLMEGYVFVASGLAEATFFNLERETPYVKRVLSGERSNGIPALQVVPNSSIEEMRMRLRECLSSEISVGMRVRITQGTYAKLDGTVLDMEDEDAHVHLKMRSFETIRSIPRVFLEPVEEEGTT